MQFVFEIEVRGKQQEATKNNACVCERKRGRERNASMLRERNK